MSASPLIDVPATVRESALLALMYDEGEDPEEGGHTQLMEQAWLVEKELRREGYTLGYRFDEPSDYGRWDSALFDEFVTYWMVGNTKNRRRTKPFRYSHIPRRTKASEDSERAKRRLRNQRTRNPPTYEVDRALSAVEKALKRAGVSPCC